MSVTPIRIAHQVWSRLPPGLRRRLYDGVTERIAPAAGSSEAIPARCEQPYVVIGPLSAPTGLGEASRLLLHGLISAGRSVSMVDLSAALMQPSVVPLPALPPPAAGPGTVLIAAQPPTVAHCLILAGRSLLRGKRRVGFWAWELDRVPPVWQRSEAFVHEVATPSAFCAAIFARAFHVPVRQVPFPLALGPVSPAVGAPRREVVFGSAFDLGSTAARKNPSVVLDAFGRAFGAQDGVKLIVRMRDRASEPAAAAALDLAARRCRATVEFVEPRGGERTLDAWWNAIDVFVSLHRSEGFGLMPAEAMQRGIPVISTDWSATREFVSADCGWPVPARLVPAEDLTGRYALPGALWAEADVDAAAAAMQEAAASPELRYRKGQAARARIAEGFTAQRFLAALEAGADHRSPG